MGDIKRNQTTGIPPATQTVNEGTEERKIVPGGTPKGKSMQVHFGNVDALKLRLLDEINQGVRTLVHLLDPDGKKRAELLKAFQKDDQLGGTD
jgi:hypothetical protein